jgi:hypothetical protein
VETAWPTSLKIGAQWQSNSCLYLGVQRHVQLVEQQEVSVFDSFCQLEPLCGALLAGQLQHVQNNLSHPEGTGQWSGGYIPCCLIEADLGTSLKGNFHPACTLLSWWAGCHPCLFLC